MELDKTLRQGSCVWRAGRNLGAGDRWRGRVNLVMRGWGAEGRSRQNVGSLVEGLPGTLGGAEGSRSLEPEGAGIVWNCGRDSSGWAR